MHFRQVARFIKSGHPPLLPFPATHVMPLEEGPRGYEIFQKKEDGAVKVLLKP